MIGRAVAGRGGAVVFGEPGAPDAGGVGLQGAVGVGVEGNEVGAFGDFGRGAEVGFVEGGGDGGDQPDFVVTATAELLDPSAPVPFDVDATDPGPVFEGGAFDHQVVLTGSSATVDFRPRIYRLRHQL